MFLNHFLKGPVNGINCLRYLSIQVIFQVLSFGFYQHYTDLKSHVDGITKNEGKKPSQWLKVFSHLEGKCLSYMFERPDTSFMTRKLNFQVEFGYNTCLHYLLLICGETGVEGKQDQSGIPRKKQRSSIGKPASLFHTVLFEVCTM